MSGPDTDRAARAVIDSYRGVFARQKSMAERAMAQLSDAQLHQPAAERTNSIAVIVRHMTQSMRSRWTDWLTTDGEKPWRDREAEFADDASVSREDLMRGWNESWGLVLGAMDALTAEDLTGAVTIRGEPHTVPEAVARQIDHYAYHVAQIVFIAKLLKGDAWEHLTVPPGGTAAYNERMRKKFGRF